VGDLAGEQEALVASGVTVDKGPTDTVYDMRELEIVDPDGYRWCIGQDTSEVANAEVWEGVLDVGKARPRLVLKLSGAAGGEVHGLLDSIDQGAMNLPVENVARDATILRFAMSGHRRRRTKGRSARTERSPAPGRSAVSRGRPSGAAPCPDDRRGGDARRKHTHSVPSHPRSRSPESRQTVPNRDNPIVPLPGRLRGTGLAQRAVRSS
jgi:hypothetical protein